MESCKKEVLKMALLSIFQNESIPETKMNLIIGLDSIRESIPLEEISTDEIIALAVPFLIAYPGNKQALIEYVEFLQKLNIFDLRHEEADKPTEFSILHSSKFGLENRTDSEIHNSADSLQPEGILKDFLCPSNTLSFNIYDKKKTSECLISEDSAYKFDPEKVMRDIIGNSYDRSARIYLISKVKSFKFDFIDWEDRDFLIEMIKYTFYKSLLALRTITNEENIKQKPSEASEEPRSMESYKLYSCGHVDKIYDERKELLSRRLKPTMTMDELTSIAVTDMKKREEKSKIKEKNIIDKIEDSDSKSRDEYERLDSVKEDARSFPGNTKNIG